MNEGKVAWETIKKTNKHLIVKGSVLGTKSVDVSGHNTSLRLVLNKKCKEFQ